MTVCELCLDMLALVMMSGVSLTWKREAQNGRLEVLLRLWLMSFRTVSRKWNSTPTLECSIVGVSLWLMAHK